LFKKIFAALRAGMRGAGAAYQCVVPVIASIPSEVIIISEITMKI